MKKLTLHDLTEKEFIFKKKLDEGLVEEKDLEIIDMEIEEKIESYASIIANNDIELEKLREYKQKIDQKIKSKENNRESLSNHILSALKRMGRNVQEFGVSQISIKESEYLKVHSEDKVPSKYKKISQKIDINKVEITKAIKNGENIPGVELKKREKINIC